MPKYHFGCPWLHSHYREWIIEVRTVELAIKIFKVKVLFPELYVHEDYIESREYISRDRELDHDIVFKKGVVPKIGIFTRVEVKKGKDKWKSEGEITLTECVNVDYNDLIPQKDVKLLEGASIEDEESEEIQSYPVIKNVHHIKTMNKQQLRDAQQEIEAMREKMELQMSELRDSLAIMQKEVAAKMKLLLAVEVFLGVHEDVYELKSGVLAEESVPLTVYQQKLFMDEEVGIFTDQGLDHFKIDKFDKWITKHYKNFLFAEKSVCVFQVRRNRKEYSKEDPMMNAVMNVGNFKTYFLIRNGECLYRMWAGITIGDQVFPALKEYEEFLKRKEKSRFCHSKEEAIKQLKEMHQEYMMGLIYIQGLIERSPIFGTTIKDRVNLIKGKFTEKDIVLIRDAEQGRWLGDGRPTWKEFIKENQASIKQGSRIVFDMESDGRYGAYEAGRASFNCFDYPKEKSIYIAEEMLESDYDSYKVKIRFNPKDKIWSPYAYDTHTRTRRIGWKLYLSECINIDAITPEEIDYYAGNRLEREWYLKILPVLFFAKQVKLDEEKQEEGFRLMMLSLLDWPISREPEVKSAVKWWKLKNKWKRGIDVDNAKATRMIKRYLTKQEKE